MIRVAKEELLIDAKVVFGYCIGTMRDNAAGWGLPGWRKVTRRLKGAGNLLDVYCRRDEGEWIDHATWYWSQKHEGLARVPSAETSILHVGTVPGSSDTFFFKRFLARDWRDFIKDLVRPSRARRALLGDESIRLLGHIAPRPVCLLEERVFGVLRSSALVTEAVRGMHPLADLIGGHVAGAELDRTAKNRLLASLAEETAALHSAGISHGDMRGGNIMVGGDDGRQICWLDNERTVRRTRAQRRLVVRNLVQLNMLRDGVGSRDRVLFWRTYRRARRLSRAESRALRDDVVRRTTRRWSKRGWV